MTNFQPMPATSVTVDISAIGIKPINATSFAQYTLASDNHEHLVTAWHTIHASGANTGGS